MLGEFFDPKANLFIHDRLRPHWSQAGAVVFVTFRTKDSIPEEVLCRWAKEKNEWLDQRGKRDGTDLRCGKMWHAILANLPSKVRTDFNKHFNRQRESFLDICHGKCHLRNPQYAKIVADSLMHFDGDRYQMGDFVVMPNHVHLLAAFATQESMESQFDSWLHFSATQINRQIGECGHFWQQEPFDHLVRSPEQYEYLRNYIRDNPKNAKLRDGEFYYRRLPDCR